MEKTDKAGLPEDVQESLLAAVRSYPVREILDFIATAMRESAHEIGYEDNEITWEDDARIVAHAASHIKS